MNDFEKDVIIYLANEMNLDPTIITAEVVGTEIHLKPTRWIEDWADIMDYVDSMDGQWVSPERRWEFPKERVEERIDYDKAHNLWNPRGLKID